ncbi:MAG TPA: hypothetical protein VL400_14085 [Polyangiaceae bacterium]|jgi:hypothetical protein|nr:hypothetical protein [Polyangiaceae bacterium]
MLGLAVVFGIGSIILARVLFQSKNASVLQASSALGAVIERAESAPGADAVEKAGCSVGAVIPVADLKTLGQSLEDEEARRKGRVAKVVDTGADPVVYCGASKSEGAPTCGAIATAFVATAPTAAFVVTVHADGRELCSERFDPKGGPLGPAPSPNVPEL